MEKIVAVMKSIEEHGWEAELTIYSDESGGIVLERGDNPPCMCGGGCWDTREFKSAVSFDSIDQLNDWADKSLKGDKCEH